MSKTKKNILYQKIIDDILAQIESGVLKPGDKLPTEMDLMKKYSVSRITASKAMAELKDRGLISRFHHKGSFINEPEGEISSKKSFQRIAFIIPQIIDRFALSIFNGIHAALPRDEYMLFMMPSADSDGESRALKVCLDSGVDGIILFPVDQEYYSDQVLSMKINKYPFVLIDRFFPGIDTNYVISDNQKSGQLAAEYLCKLGHRKIAVFSNAHQTPYSVKERIKGYHQGLKNCGLTSDEKNIYAVSIEKQDNASIQKLLKTICIENQVTAIIAMQTNSALLLHQGIRAMGLRIPEDISVISFDNPMSGMNDFNFFTHIDQDEYQMGFLSAQILKDMIVKKTDESESLKKLVLSPSLVISSSTAPVANK